MPFIESFEEFRIRQDCEFIDTSSGRLFQNGAFWNTRTNKGVDPPPKDSEQFAVNRYNYENHRLEKIRKHTVALANDIEERTALVAQYPTSDWLMPPTPEMLEELKRLHAKLEVQEAVVDELENAVNSFRRESPHDQHVKKQNARVADAVRIRNQARKLFGKESA